MRFLDVYVVIQIFILVLCVGCAQEREEYLSEQYSECAGILTNDSLRAYYEMMFQRLENGYFTATTCPPELRVLVEQGLVVTPTLIEFLNHNDPVARMGAYDALYQITGQQFGG